jgi:hypothetical protein
LPTGIADQKSSASVLEDGWVCWTTKVVTPVRISVLSFAKFVDLLFARFAQRRASRVSPELCEITLALTAVLSSEAWADKCVVATSAVAASAVAASAVAACAVAASAAAAAASEVVSLPPKAERGKNTTV